MPANRSGSNTPYLDGSILPRSCYYGPVETGRQSYYCTRRPVYLTASTNLQHYYALWSNPLVASCSLNRQSDDLTKHSSLPPRWRKTAWDSGWKNRNRKVLQSALKLQRPNNKNGNNLQQAQLQSVGRKFVAKGRDRARRRRRRRRGLGFTRRLGFENT
jgi:hypothetical protein